MSRMLPAPVLRTPAGEVRHHERAVILVGALVALAVGLWTCWSLTVDDAFITYRYSDNLARGHGLVWNPGQDPVEGFTNFAWMAWHVPFAAAGVPLPLVSKVTAGLCAATTVWLLVRETRTRAGALVAAGCFALFLPTWVHTMSGLETAPFALVVLRAVVVAARSLQGVEVRVWELPVLVLVAGMLRPDGILAVGVPLLVWLYLRRAELAPRVWSVAAGVVGAAYMGWRWSYFGHALPNTFYTKVGVDAATDGRWIQMTAALLLPLLVVAAAGLLGARPGPVVVALAACAALYVVPALSAPAMDYLSRFAWHGFPLLCLAAGWVLDQVEARRAAAIAASVALVWTTVAGVLHPDGRTLVNYGVDLQRAHVAIGKALADQELPPTERSVAVTDAGAIPYFSEWAATDYIGLNDERIAHGADPTGVLLADAPTVVVVTSSSGEQPTSEGRVDLPTVLGDRVWVGSVQMRDGYFEHLFAPGDVAGPLQDALAHRTGEAHTADPRLDLSYWRWVQRLISS